MFDCNWASAGTGLSTGVVVVAGEVGSGVGSGTGTGTGAGGVAGAVGAGRFRGFLGEYRVTVTRPTGEPTTKTFTLTKQGPNRWTVK